MHKRTKKGHGGVGIHGNRFQNTKSIMDGIFSMVGMCSSAMYAKNKKNVEGHHRKWVKRPWGHTRMALGWTYGGSCNYGDGCLLGSVAKN